MAISAFASILQNVSLTRPPTRDVVDRVTTPNADGTQIIVTTNFADGTSVTQTRPSPKTAALASQVTTINEDGSITTVTTYADGTSSVSTQPNPYPASSANGLELRNTARPSVVLWA